MAVTQDALSARLLDAITEARKLLPVLSAMLSEADSGGPRTGTMNSNPPSSTEPWNTAVAEAYWRIWAGAGQLANNLRACLGMARWNLPPRGHQALDAIRDLAPSCPPEAVKLAVLRLERWVDRAMQLPAIDETEPWVPLPLVGVTPPECPYCGMLALRMRKRAGQVTCFFPGCTDADGKPTRARMEPGRMTGEARLVFGDGTTMAF